MNPLVSILIPAYNAEEYISQTIESASAQTWGQKEIIVVNDGSTDRTAEVAQRFASKQVQVVSIANGGAAAARNHALQLCQGDYIQWLDADDLLTPDKIERQLQAAAETGSRRVLLSSPWGSFYYRTQKVRFLENSLCQDLSPVEWLIRKMSENLHMQTGTWLTSRELVEAAGPWDTRLLSDDDGEYFCRVLLASSGIKFVPGTGVLYRVVGASRLSWIGFSDRKREAQLTSMRLHIRYLRSLEESDRVHRACVTYIQNWYPIFYPDRMDLVAELQELAAELQGILKPPQLRRKYAWMTTVLGRRAANRVQEALPRWKQSLFRGCDRVLWGFEKGKSAGMQQGNQRH